MDICEQCSLHVSKVKQS